MFEKKYVFETRSTKLKRFYLKLLWGLVFVFAVFILFLFYIPFFASDQREKVDEAFFKKAPDVIAVFTGDGGRISYGLELAEKYPSAKLFITGVYAKNTLKTLLEKQASNLSVDEYLEQESHHIDLEYLARNTVENGLATLNYLATLNGHEDVLIITSDYHVLRSYLIMKTLKGPNDKYALYFEGRKSDYTQWRSLKILIKETYKLLTTSTFLLFWDRDPPNQHSSRN